MNNPAISRKAVKQYLKDNLSNAMPTPFKKIDDKLFDPTAQEGRNSCLIHLPQTDFDEYHGTIQLDLMVCVWKQDEDDWIGAIWEFFTENRTLGGSVVLADLKTLDLMRDLLRPDFLYLQAGITLTI